MFMPYTSLSSHGLTFTFFFLFLLALKFNYIFLSCLCWQARPSLVQGDLESILDPFLMIHTYNRDMMLFMAQLGMRCVERSPKDRPIMRQICEELEFHLYSQILQPSRSLVHRQGENVSNEGDENESFVHKLN